MHRRCCRPCLKALRELPQQHQVGMKERAAVLREFLQYLQRKNCDDLCSHCSLVDNVKADLFDLESRMMH